MKTLYFCVGCSQIHYDSDYCELDGDLIIKDWDSFLVSVEGIKVMYNLSKGDGK